MTKKTKAVRLISRIMAAVMAFSACQQGFMLSAFAESGLTLTPKFHENATVEVSGSKVTVTDTSFNDDVWNSKVLLDTGMTLVPGKQYKINYNISGPEGVGELFLCKTESMDARYNDTFSTDSGDRCMTFNAIGDKLFIGMQVGNVGADNSVTLDVASISEVVPSGEAEVLISANSDVTLEGRTLTATDTQDNNDVWNSKVLFDAGIELIPGKMYDMDLELIGENGVGEFFLCKSLDLNDRVDATFRNTPGTKHITFTAKSNRMYVGMQFGNIGKGNTVICKLTHVALHKYQDPPVLQEVKEVGNRIYIKVTDNNAANSDVWDSKAYIPVSKNLEVGKEYEITLKISGAKGRAEVFLSTTGQDRYARSDAQGPEGQVYDVFTQNDGTITMRFVATSPAPVLTVQCGNLGIGNSVNVEVIKPAEYNPDEGLYGNTGAKSAEKCTYTESYDNDPVTNDIKIVATDTSVEEGVWTSKVISFLGDILTAGKEYIARVITKGVGEFFLLKGDEINDDNKYVGGGIWRNNADQAEETWNSDLFFTAESSNTKLYTGMQFGNAGVGKGMEAQVVDVFQKTFLWGGQNNEGCYESHGRDSITVTDDNDDNNFEGWSSKARYSTGITLEEGVEYVLKFKLDGSNVGSGSCVVFQNAGGITYHVEDEGFNDAWFGNNEEYEVHIIGDGSMLYMNVECGTLGKGNSMTVSNFHVTKSENSQPTVMSLSLAPVSAAAVEEVAETVEEAEEVTETLTEETAEVVEEITEPTEEVEVVEVVEEVTEEIEEITEETEETEPETPAAEEPATTPVESAPTVEAPAPAAEVPAPAAEVTE